jgi:hypothetical protein
MWEQWDLKRVDYLAAMKESQWEAAQVFQSVNRSVGKD